MAVVRFHVPNGDAGTFLSRAAQALDALSACAGFEGGSVGPATDDPQSWVMVTRWASVGQYRRGLSSYDVKLRAHPLLYQAVDEPSAFEELVAVAADGTVRTSTTDRSGDGRPAVSPAFGSPAVGLPAVGLPAVGSPAVEPPAVK